MKNLTIFLTLFLSSIMSFGQTNNFKTVSKNGMAVKWSFKNDQIYFEMTAPTTGWVTIGFNADNHMKDAYLLMGHVVKNKTNVVEYYTINPGNYKPITALGATASVADVLGEETSNQTTIKFSIPTKANSKFQKELVKGSVFTMILAYSQADEFENHSIMRTAMEITL